MERFAFKIDKVLRANLYKICRLCGIDNPDKVPILREKDQEIVDVDLEPELSQKIHDCIGFLISKNDKMPQMICSLCVDKINDFYEFREMCYATNIQTRKLLGLKDAPKKNVEIKVEVKTEPQSTAVDKRGRKRKSDDIITEADIKIESDRSKVTANSNLSKKRVRLGLVKQKTQVVEPEKVKTEVKNEPPVETVKALTEDDMKLKQICKICMERFGSKYKLDRHQIVTHIPNIPRYVCMTCDETLKKNGDIKSHQLWHKLSKTPYTCALCREKMSSINMFTRHMREHAQKLATPLVVLDRQCAQCHVTFCTNFLYNTHPCAVRTRKCGGCNRQIKNDVDYQRHASTCDKAYLVISKYLSAALEPVRIKNENDVEAAAAESFGMSAGASKIAIPSIATTSLSPMDSILKTTDLASTNKSTKKSGKKGMSKKDLKRIDNLLKSTMDTLVSIKHEPEMHVDADVLNHTEQQDNNLNDLNDNNYPPSAFDYDDFQNRDDSSDDGSPFVPIVELQTGSEIIIKQEPNDGTNQDTASTSKTPNVVTIKKELPDSGYEDSSATGSIAKVPVLKLKITKEHGTLNSSLVDESSTSREKKKKKKKRKDVDKVNEQTDNNENLHESPLHTPEVSPTKSQELLAMPEPGIIRIKQERMNDGYPEENIANEPVDLAANYSTEESMQPEATVMTSIPMMQLQISCVSSGVDFNETVGEKEEQQDIKPNRAELDRWLENNSNIISATDSEVDELSRNEEIHNSNTPKPRPNRSQQTKKTTCRSKAVKSTGGISRQNSSVHEMPKIVAVSSGFDAIAAHNDNSASSHDIAVPNITIKSEPYDVGYENIEPTEEPMSSDHEMETSSPLEDDVNNDEQAYINSIDFSNISIKQEKDIDVSESQLTAQEIPLNLYNGTDDVVMESMTDRNNEIGEKRSVETACKPTADEAEDAEEAEDEEEEMELDEVEDNIEREYRELEWPPPLNEAKNQVEENQPMCLGLMITSVCSQADEADNQKSDNPSSTEDQAANINESFKNSNTKNLTEISLPMGISSDSSTTLNSFLPISNAEKEPGTEVNDGDVSSLSLEAKENADNLLELSSCSKSIDNESYMEMNPIEETTVEERQNLLNHQNINEEQQNILNHENIDVERQNILNQEVFANSEMQAHNRISTNVALNQQTVQQLIQTTDIQISCNDAQENSTPAALSSVGPSTEKSTSSAILTVCDEETDNFLNENVDAADHCRQQEQESMHGMPSTSNAQNILQQRALLVDDSNINEIAENNNNANIERELLDDNSNNVGRISPPSIVEQDNNNDEVT